MSLNAERLKFFQVHFPMLLAVAFTSPKGSKFFGLHNVFKLMAWFSISRIQESKFDEP
jgi:hypothetical protein